MHPYNKLSNLYKKLSIYFKKKIYCPICANLLPKLRRILERDILRKKSPKHPKKRKTREYTIIYVFCGLVTVVSC